MEVGAKRFNECSNWETKMKWDDTKPSSTTILGVKDPLFDFGLRLSQIQRKAKKPKRLQKAKRQSSIGKTRKTPGPEKFGTLEFIEEARRMGWRYRISYGSKKLQRVATTHRKHYV